MSQPFWVPYDEINIGDTACREVTFTEKMVLEFSALLGDTDSFHVLEESAAITVFQNRIVHGIHIAAYLSVVIGQQLPGFGTIYCSQTMDFLNPVYLDETVSVEVKVLEKLPHHRLQVSTQVFKTNGVKVLDGKALLKTYA